MINSVGAAPCGRPIRERPSSGLRTEVLRHTGVAARPILNEEVRK